MTLSSIIPALLADAARLTMDDDARRWAAMVDRLSAALTAEHERAEKLAAKLQGIEEADFAEIRAITANRDALAQKLAEAERRCDLLTERVHERDAELGSLKRSGKREAGFTNSYIKLLHEAETKNDALARQVEELQAQAIRDNEALTRMQNAGYAAEARMEAIGRVVDRIPFISTCVNNSYDLTLHSPDSSVQEANGHLAVACDELRIALAALTDAKGAKS